MKSAPVRPVLVVDDDAATLTSLTDVLAARGFQVVGTCTGPEALSTALDTRPDLVLVDAVASRDGEVVRALRFERDLEHVVVVMLVGDRHRDQARGAE